jgi:hypothetical protein
MIPRNWCYISLLGGTKLMTHISTNSKSAFQMLLNQLTCKYWPMSGLTHHEHWWDSSWNQVSCNKISETLYLCCTHCTAAQSLLFQVTFFTSVQMFVCCECYVLSGRGLCDELITRPEESNRLWGVIIWKPREWGGPGPLGDVALKTNRSLTITLYLKKTLNGPT